MKRQSNISRQNAPTPWTSKSASRAPKSGWRIPNNPHFQRTPLSNFLRGPVGHKVGPNDTLPPTILSGSVLHSPFDGERASRPAVLSPARRSIKTFRAPRQVARSLLAPVLSRSLSPTDTLSERSMSEHASALSRLAFQAGLPGNGPCRHAWPCGGAVSELAAKLSGYCGLPNVSRLERGERSALCSGCPEKTGMSVV